jgi:hypothetical protein
MGQKKGIFIRIFNEEYFKGNFDGNIGRTVKSMQNP